MRACGFRSRASSPLATSSPPARLTAAPSVNEVGRLMPPARSLPSREGKRSRRRRDRLGLQRPPVCREQIAARGSLWSRRPGHNRRFAWRWPTSAFRSPDRPLASPVACKHLGDRAAPGSRNASAPLVPRDTSSGESRSSASPLRAMGHQFSGQSRSRWLQELSSPGLDDFGSWPRPYGPSH
jgi:hypothetical protein